jgi:hypothetical protein
MADVREQRIFTTDQIKVHPELPFVLKDFAKEVITKNPQNILKFGREYFEKKIRPTSPSSSAGRPAAAKHTDEEE